MSFALFASPATLAPLQGFFRWFGASPLPAHRLVTPPAFLRSRARIGPAMHELAAQRAPRELGNTKRIAAGTAPRSLGTALPAVRVVRMLEAGQSRASVGRMVISGRMADVCAELDRLVRREEALH